MIATVDKFASLPWVGASGRAVRRVERHDAAGFYGPCDPASGEQARRGRSRRRISSSRTSCTSSPVRSARWSGSTRRRSTRCARARWTGETMRPKIVASTATVRRAEAQIRALFARSGVDVFPPPGPDRRDSFFAQHRARSRSSPAGLRGRRRPGPQPEGRPAAHLPGAARGGAEGMGRRTAARRTATNPADPYMTLLGYFNSLRELGGSRRIVEDEVRRACSGYGASGASAKPTGRFADRTIAATSCELTSREPTDRGRGDQAAPGARRSREQTERVDVALATNMISVGLDITRLGLMVVLGQPKTAAEYIQATSRVGRDARTPGSRGHAAQRPQAARPLALRAVRGVPRVASTARSRRPA